MPLIFSAAKALILDGDEYLLFEQKVGNDLVFDLPGGKIKFGETPEQALQRELKEEINLSIDAGKLLGVYWFFRKDTGDQIICATFLCEVNGRKIDLSKNTSSSEKIIRGFWVTKQELREKMQEPGFSKIIDAL